MMTDQTRNRLRLAGALATGLAFGLLAQALAEQHERMPTRIAESAQAETEELWADEAAMNDDELMESSTETRTVTGEEALKA